MDRIIAIIACIVFLAVQISAQAGSYNGYGRCIGCEDGVAQSSDKECIACERDGRYYSPKAKFSYRDGCFMMNCFCYCNGSYNCPKEDSVDMCFNSRRRNTGNERVNGGSNSNTRSSTNQGGYGGSNSNTRSSTRTRSEISGSGAVARGSPRGDCRYCYPYGEDQPIPANTKFTYKNGCLEYSDCFCPCDGFWQCPAQRVRNTCSSSGSGIVIRGSEGTCRQCDAHGLIVEPDTYFTYRNGCIEWSNCRCECSGDWLCPSDARDQRWICENVCRQCNINGTTYRANTVFSYRKDCFEYDECHCHCNGSWNCPAERGRWACSHCRTCDVKGLTKQGDTTFKYREDCWEWENCVCNCNGSWNCPKENAKWVCKKRCLDCNINGTIHKGNSPFQVTKGCYQYNCDCGCDGGWNCPPNRTIDICNMNLTTGCFYCDVHGERYQGNSAFSHSEECINYTNCVCNCDGSWDCPGRNAIDTCRQNSSTGCYYCDVRGRNFQGQSRFQLTEDCWRFECECDCDGRWRCSEQAVYTCGSHVLPGRCRECHAAGARYAARQPFDLSWGCINYNCQCNCDGSWICPANKAEIICESSYFQNFQIRTISSTPSSWCKECHFGGYVYPGNSQFEYQIGCVRHYARCYCNGGFRKTSSIVGACARQILTGSISGSISSTSTGVITSGGTTSCRRCVINGNTFRENSQFELKVGCASYTCQCSCTGLPQCQSTTSTLCGSVLSSIGQISRTDGSTLVVRGGGTSGGRSVVVGGGGVSRTTVVGGGSGTRIVGGGSTVINRGSSRGGTVVLESGRTSSSESRSVSVGGRTVVGGTNVVVRGGSTSVGGGTVGGTVSRGGSVVVAGNGGSGVILTGGQRCGFCIVDGRRYRGGTTFEFRRDCFLFSCRCDCRGRAICIPSAMTNCPSEPNPGQCRECVVNGRSYRPNTNFQYQQDCNLVSCRCDCNGQESCVSRSITNCRIDTCRPCNVNGKRRHPNTAFDLQDGCQRYRCQCHCNGRHTCSRPVNTCDGQSTRECRNCVLSGVTYPTNTPFMYERGCWRMRCRCDCDGYHNCDRQSAEYTCDVEPPEPPTTCVRCRSDGRQYEANTKFTRRRGCLVQRCQCFCDGRVQCVRTNIYACARGTVVDVEAGHSRGSGSSTSSTSVVVTSGGTRGTERPSRTGSSSSQNTTQTSGTSSRDESVSSETTGSGSRCTNCLVDGVERAFGSTFYVERRCKRYTCRCPCEGKFICETGSPENICDEDGRRKCRSCTVSDQVYKANARFQLDYDDCRKYQCTCKCDGTYECPTSDIINTCQREPRCQTCEKNGQIYQPNSRFSYTEGCEKFNCSCECDGTINCPGDLIEDICRIDSSSGNCRSCNVEDHGIFPPNRRFQYDENCYRFECNCHCDGSWRCPSSRKSYICDTPQNQCRPCRANGTSYRPNTRFQFDRGCNRFDCDCYCNGTHVCPAERTRNLCPDGQSENRNRGSGGGDSSTLNGCRPCEVIGRMYRPNKRFQYDENCDRYDCHCRCNGSWICDPERTKNICHGGGRVTYPGQCRECVVDDRKYPPNTRFAYDEDCFRFDCDCRCNGSWTCPGERTRDICGGRGQNTTVPGQCRPCIVNNRSYRPNSRFQFDKDCNRFDCDCGCNGSWICPTERTRDICRGRGRDTDTSEQCRPCVVNERSYRPKTRFQYDEDCNRFDCDCRCNGSFTCPAERTRDICGGRGRGTDTSGQCRPCVVNERSYRPNSRFQYDEDCNRFDCDCRCDGSFTCPADRTRNICRTRPDRGRPDGQTRPDRCRECVVNERSYAPNSRFKYDKDCYRLDCDCYCNGSYACPAERTVQICRSDAQGSEKICRDCQIGDQQYRSNARFQYTVGCDQFDCDCHCDGFYNCPARRTKNICGGGSRKCSKECDVRGVTYPVNSIFVLREQCLQMQCQCYCDGNWDCDQSKTKDVCKEQ